MFYSYIDAFQNYELEPSFVIFIYFSQHEWLVSDTFFCFALFYYIFLRTHVVQCTPATTRTTRVRSYWVVSLNENKNFNFNVRRLCSCAVFRTILVYFNTAQLIKLQVLRRVNRTIAWYRLSVFSLKISLRKHEKHLCYCILVWLLSHVNNLYISLLQTGNIKYSTKQNMKNTFSVQHA